MKYWHFPLLLPVNLHKNLVPPTEHCTVGQSFGGSWSHSSSSTRLLQESLLPRTALCQRGNTGVPNFCSCSYQYTYSDWPIRLQFLISQHWEHVRDKVIWESMSQDHTDHPRSPYGDLTNFLVCSIKQ